MQTSAILHPMLLSQIPVNAAICAVVHLTTQPRGVLQQVTIRHEKTHDNLVRFGETPGDEANCWIAREHVDVIAVLGDAHQGADNVWTVSECKDDLVLRAMDSEYEERRNAA